MSYGTFVQGTVDTNRNQSDLAHLEGQQLHAHRAKVATTARNILQDLIRSIPATDRELLATINIDDPTTDEEALIERILSTLTPAQASILDDAFTDTIVVADQWANGMTRYDMPERTEGTITADRDPTGFLAPDPGQPGSEYSSYRNWALDQITTMMTGIHPVHGDVPVFKSRCLALLADPRFRKVVKSTGIKIADLYKALDAVPDHPVTDDEPQYYPPPRSSKPFSNLYPPPAPEDETPPGAQRPRPNNYHRGVCMQQDATDPYLSALHQATDLLRTALKTENPALRATLLKAARTLSRQISTNNDALVRPFAALASKFTRRPHARRNRF